MIPPSNSRDRSELIGQFNLAICPAINMVAISRRLAYRSSPKRRRLRCRKTWERQIAVQGGRMSVLRDVCQGQTTGDSVQCGLSSIQSRFIRWQVPVWRTHS
ncbi:hypothetical protein PHLGIDRAFT_350782 [Phlebiopsis gigantea 11061_1 CR5-6]|uniref:Uncharacterized protein n=1 Tax=Phlebiopsis gigantea (strain 11061_1 CR5-6) TaxID=745531 RepID=A0A0C3SA92_PHLG1|nr:hypothetical protein PHLGIDRAFT_350782 [Phlebiopsis gigantea 11061_1 CR5-6]